MGATVLFGLFRHDFEIPQRRPADRRIHLDPLRSVPDHGDHPGPPPAVTFVRPRNPGLQIVRGLCVVGSSILFVYGVRQMTMAQATTISFLSPLLITVLSIPLLGETVGTRRWAASPPDARHAGRRPSGLGGFQPAALFGVASAFCWALALIITRKIAASDPPQTTVLWSAGIGTAVLTLLLPFQAVWPHPKQLGCR